MAQKDPAVIDVGGFVTAKVDGGYTYFATHNPQGELTDLLGQASGKTAEIAERYSFKDGGWMALGSIETSGYLARERVPETEVGNLPP